MLNYLIKKWAKWRAYFMLERDAHKAEMDALFIQSGVPEMAKIIESARKEMERLEAKYKELESEHEYTKRKERGEVENAINAEKARIEQYQKTAGGLEGAAQESRSRAAQFRTRSKFIRDNF